MALENGWNILSTAAASQDRCVCQCGAISISVPCCWLAIRWTGCLTNATCVHTCRCAYAACAGSCWPLPPSGKASWVTCLFLWCGVVCFAVLQLCFDFIESSADGRLYSIECNPRTSTVITEFHDNPELAAGTAPASIAVGTGHMRGAAERLQKCCLAVCLPLVCLALPSLVSRMFKQLYCSAVTAA
jgi:hypothetical protein